MNRKKKKQGLFLGPRPGSPSQGGGGVGKLAKPGKKTIGVSVIETSMTDVEGKGNSWENLGRPWSGFSRQDHQGKREGVRGLYQKA